MKKIPEILSFYTCLPQMTIIWCMISEIRCVADWIFCKFGPLFFVPHCQPEKSKFQKNEKKKQNKTITKTPGDIIILHKCTRNHDHLLYCSWDMASDGCNCYFSVWAIFCNFTPHQLKKSKFKKNEKTPGDAIILHTCTKNYD